MDCHAFRGGLATGPGGGEEGVDVGVASEVSDNGSHRANMELEVLGELVGGCAFGEVSTADLVAALAGELGCWKRCASSSVRAIAVESQIGKLSAPEGRPGRGFIPGVGETRPARKARNGGVLAGSAGNEGEGKEARRGRESRTTYLLGTQAADLRSHQNRGKTQGRPKTIGCEIGKLGVRENRRRGCSDKAGRAEWHESRRRKCARRTMPSVPTAAKSIARSPARRSQ